MKNSKNNKPDKLLVEGNDDLHVIQSLCKKFSVPDNFEVIDCKGIEELLKDMPVRFTKGSDLKNMGIIVDADVNLNMRWESIKSIISKLQMDVPDILPNNGLILTNQDNKKFGVWIMPNNRTNGMLEDFISFLVPHNNKLLPIAKETLDNIERQNLNNYSINHRAKALIHTWLAWQEAPGIPMGQSITRRYLNTDNETCQNLIKWMVELFQ